MTELERSNLDTELDVLVVRLKNLYLNQRANGEQIHQLYMQLMIVQQKIKENTEHKERENTYNDHVGVK